ncbi:MAG: ABC transporter permease [Bacteroidales bacterium]|nr:ABC transporter permease [Bacteroidales bacterium]
MKRFRGFVIKEFRHIFRDPRTLVILFGLPVVMIVLFGYVVSNDLKDIRLAILDQSGDPVSKEISQKILSSDYFVNAGNLSSEDEIDRIFKSQKAKLVLVFARDFEKKLYTENIVSLRLVVDASDANSAVLSVNYAQAIIADYFNKWKGNVSIPWQVNVRSRMMYNPELRGVYMFVPGLMALILMLISALMTSVTITREKEFGTMEPLLASPLHPREIILGKVTPYVMLSFINALTILILGVLIFHVPIRGSILLLLFECLLYITLALSLGVFISSAARTQQIAMIISMVGLMLPTILLSGFIFPIENMPKVLQWFSAIMPARWFIVIIKNIMLKGTGLAFVWKETLILLFMTSFFIVMAIRRFKTRLE